MGFGDYERPIPRSQIPGSPRSWILASILDPRFPFPDPRFSSLRAPTWYQNTVLHRVKLSKVNKSRKSVSRDVSIMADAAFEILKQNPKECSGNFFIDEVILRERGQVDFEKYRLSKNELIRDFFVPDEIADNLPTKTVSVY